MLRCLFVFACAFLALLSGGCENRSSTNIWSSEGDGGGNGGESTNASPVKMDAQILSKDEAIAIAKQEVERRGWKGFKVIDCRLNDDHWSVHIERDPAVFGAHAMIQIPTNGLPLRYVPGR
jgi:hypothetical protein